MTPELIQWFTRNEHTYPIRSEADLKKAPIALRNKLLFKIEGNVEVLAALLTAGVEVNQQDQHGLTPLHYAAHNGSAECIILLIGAGAKVDATNHALDTPLLWAADRYSTLIIILLLAAGAEIDHQNSAEMSALHLAAAKGCLENVKCLIKPNIHNKPGADLNLQDHSGWTPLHHAVQNEHLEVVKCLVENGANLKLTTTNPAGKYSVKSETARQIAASFKDTRIYTYLLDQAVKQHLVKIPTFMPSGAPQTGPKTQPKPVTIYQEKKATLEPICEQEEQLGYC